MLTERVEKCPKCESAYLSRRWSRGRDFCPLNRRARSLGAGIVPCEDVGSEQEHLEVYCRGCRYIWNEAPADTPQAAEATS